MNKKKVTDRKNETLGDKRLQLGNILSKVAELREEERKVSKKSNFSII